MPPSAASAPQQRTAPTAASVRLHAAFGSCTRTVGQPACCQAVAAVASAGGGARGRGCAGSVAVGVEGELDGQRWRRTKKSSCASLRLKTYPRGSSSAAYAGRKSRGVRQFSSENALTPACGERQLRERPHGPEPRERRILCAGRTVRVPRPASQHRQLAALDVHRHVVDRRVGRE